MIFIDTNVAIALRDGDNVIEDRVALLEDRPVLSVMTRIELENGLYRGGDVAIRRILLDRILRTLPVEHLQDEDVTTYGRIVEQLGHRRQLTIDRLIAAQAISRDAALITMNGADFRKIKGLKLIEWGVLDSK